MHCRRDRLIMSEETVVLTVLSITAVLTAWCGFESAKWSGEMSVAFREVSSFRIEAARQSLID
jgi:hypothetical protein